MGSRADSGLYASLPLPNDRDCIRLLDIHPGKLGTRIECTLRCVSLDDKPAYDALSYTWGPPSKEIEIIVNGTHAVAVRENLFLALQALRKRRARWSQTTAWIDAICINQKDVVEKGEQIPLMGKIYARAACVNVWLGEAGDVPSFDLRELRSFERLHLRKDHRRLYLGGWRFPLLLQASAIWCALRNYPRIISQALETSGSLWHERAWVVQEYVMASRIQLWVGHHRRPFPVSSHRLMIVDELWRLDKLHDDPSQRSSFAYRLLTMFETLRSVYMHDDRDPRGSLAMKSSDVRLRESKGFDTNRCYEFPGNIPGGSALERFALLHWADEHNR